MLPENKINILSEFFTRTIIEDSPNVNILLKLDDEYKKTYSENRSKKSFHETAIIANKSVITKVINDEL
jgi:hypothetical protein